MCSKILFPLISLQGIYAVDYTVILTGVPIPGGQRFSNEIGIDYSRETMISATEFIWRLFQQNTETQRKNVTRVTLFVEDITGVAYAVNGEIHVNFNYLQSYSGDVRREYIGVLYHEMTHILQWNGNDQTPGGLIEGIADYVRLRAGYAPSHWVGPGGGDRWDQGYDVTARFLDYCNSLRNGFVARLNENMRNGYDANIFVAVLGKSVDQLWTEYKAMYNNA